MVMQVRRTLSVGATPTGLAEGQLSVGMADNPPTLWAGVPTSVDPSGVVQLIPASGSVDQTALATALADYLPLTGGTLTGNLILSADAIGALGAVTLQQLQASSGNPQGGGRLTVPGLFSVPSILFAPFNGDAIRINGVFYPIPTAGVSGVVNNAFIDGVGGQTLAPTTAYFVYVFDNFGTLALDFSLTGHSTSVAPGNVGVEIKTGDPSRTLVGYVLTGSAPAAFFDTPAYRYIRSWLNRPIAAFGTDADSYSEFPNGSWGLTACNTQILSFANEQLFYTVSGTGTNSANGDINIALWLDGAAVQPPFAGVWVGTPNMNVNMSVSGAMALSEGNHRIGVAGLQYGGLTDISLSVAGIVG